MTESSTSRFSSYRQFDDAKIHCRECHVGHVYDHVVCSDGCFGRPRVVVCGEAPGADEVVEGRPFVGAAGKVLRPVMNEFGFRKSNATITNVIPCRPERNQFPDDDDLVRRCMAMWLCEELRILDPDLLLVLGATPLKFLLMASGITAIRGRWCRLPNWHREVWAMPTYHPAFVLRKSKMQGGDEILAQFRSDIKAVAVRAGFVAG